VGQPDHRGGRRPPMGAGSAGRGEWEEMAGVRSSELEALELFTGCPRDELAGLAARLEPITAAPGEVLVREGEPASRFVLVAAGRADVTRAGRTREVHVADVEPGMIVGELSLLRGTPRAATVTASEPLAGYAGDEAAFLALLDVPGIADRLARTARQRLAGLVRPVPVRLRDDSELLLRPVLPGDRQRLSASLARFSPETLHRRFLVGSTLTERAKAYLFDVDYVDHFVWVAVSRTDQLGVADARFIRDKADASGAEVAFTVADAYQGRGVGTLLLGALAVAARQSGVERFAASVLEDNRPMRAILDRAGARWRSAGYGVVETEIDVPPPSDFLPSDDLVPPLQEAVRRVLSLAG
jgi:protein lysine acetyltransferase